MVITWSLLDHVLQHTLNIQLQNEYSFWSSKKNYITRLQLSGKLVTEMLCGVACQQGTLTLPDTWFRPPLWDLLVLQLLRPDSSILPCLYSTSHLEYPFVRSQFSCHCLYGIIYSTIFKKQVSFCIITTLTPILTLKVP